MIVIASVPHSGTMLVADIFRNSAGYNQRGLGKEADCDKTMFVGHCISHHAMLKIKKLVDDLEIVIPLRHPARVERSWIARNSSMEELNQAYRNLMAIDAEMDPIYIKIDSPDRDDYVAAAGERLGLQLHTDWPIINSKCSTHDLDLPETNLTEYVEHYERVRPCRIQHL